MGNGPPTTASDLLARYAAGERSFVRLDLDVPPWSGLSGADLEGVDFSGSFLVCDFRGTNLRNSRFRDANLKTCDFSGADLTNADFAGAALDGTTFKDAKLTGARFAGASMQGSEMKEDERPIW